MGTPATPPDRNGPDIDLTGFDETFSQTVHARSSYRTHERVYGARFGSMFDHDEGAGHLSVDLDRVHDVLPAPLSGSAERPTAGNAES